MTEKQARPIHREQAFQAPAPKARARSNKATEGYGLERTNKTVDHPGPDNESAQETVNLKRSRFIPKTPYSRG